MKKNKNIKETYGNGIRKQMMNLPTVANTSDHYNKFNLEWLAEAILDITTCKHEFLPKWNIKKLTKEDLLLYDEIIDKIKEGYLYCLQRNDINGRRIVLQTGSYGLINAINNIYRKDGYEPKQVYEAIYIYNSKNWVALKNIHWYMEEAGPMPKNIDKLIKKEKE